MIGVFRGSAVMRAGLKPGATIAVAAMLATGVTHAQTPWPANAPQSPLAPAAEARFTEGVEALKAGRLEEAEGTFREVLRTANQVAFVHHNLGVVLYRQGKQADALSEFRTAIRLDSTYGPSHLMAGTSLLGLRRPREAVVPLQSARRLMPSDIAVSARLAEAYEQLGDIPRLVDELQRTRSLAPKDPEYAYRLGRGYLALAEWSVERLRRANPGSARVQQMSARTYIQRGQTEQAIQALRAAASANPSMPEVHLALGELYLRDNQLDAAAAAAARELEIAPQSRAALALQARIEQARARAR
jgi:predicted Zn-dependent protease